ncbi:MAG: nucleotidyltransferase domain-containing protein [Defluviitaleaceae bacterium]|nr:nucleotidyltransferase domain-containing protein [Defluviitaleaceae bacterium]
MTIEEIQKKIIPIAKEYGVPKIALFGSYSRGEQKNDSDVDFLIEKGEIRGARFGGFCYDLEEALGKPVDVVMYGSLEKSAYKDYILGTEVVIYEER